MKRYGRDLTKSTAYEVALVVIAITIGVISYIYALRSNDPLWFSRSGSMIVLFCVMAEFSNNKVQQFINEAATRGAGTIGGGVGPLHQPKFRRFWSYVTHITVAAGAFIWGYGDLFVK